VDGVTYFPRELALRYRQRGYWEDRPLIAHFEDAFSRHLDRVALVHEEERITYRQLSERVERLARHLLDLGYGPLDRVVLHLPNIVEFVYVYLALQHLGAVPLAALPLHRHREISHYLSFVEARGYAIAHDVGEFDYVALARQVLSGPPTSLEHILVAGKGVPDEAPFVSIDRLLATEPRATPADLEAVRARIDPEDPCCFQLSGGTTGIPKVIPRSHNDYVYNSKVSAAVVDIRPDDALLVVLPVAHNFPLASPGIQGFLLAGARCVLSPSARAADVLPLIQRERITHLEIVPALIIRWLEDRLLDQFDLSSVRVVNSGGQKWQPQTKVRTEATFPHGKVQEVFGMAEGLLLYSRLDDHYDVRMETVGRPVCPDDEIRLVDEEGHEVPVGEIGELTCRGPYTLRGYFNVPEHNARAFTPDGFFRTGDLMRRHPSGNYVVEGRKKDVVNRAGEKISTEEVENLILQLPEVLNVACVPMPDPVLGERMCAFVIPRPRGTVTLADISAHLTGQGLGKYKHPERVELVDDFPISHFGKVQKNVLTQRITEILRAGVADLAVRT
jgi:2,3-dihydroxybenzoate-AMP ligase